jgi:GNAT superfamily N-acetyltransferase
MSLVRAFEEEDIQGLAVLINLHVSLLVPTWGLPSSFIRSHLELNPEQPVIDPWVFERATLCAFEGEKLVAAAHLLRYGTDDKVIERYFNSGDVAWFFFYPEAGEAAKELLNACHEQMRKWGVHKVRAWDSGLPLPASTGIYDAWPHLLSLFEGSNYWAKPEMREAVFVGKLDIPDTPLHKLPRGISMGQNGGNVTVVQIGKTHRIAALRIKADLSMKKGAPLLSNWAQLESIAVEDQWRRQGIATWMMRTAVNYLKKQGCHHIILAVPYEDEMAGAGEFYRSLGWGMVARCYDGWELAVPLNQ